MNFLQWTNFSMELPTAFGWFHLMFLAITLIASVLLGYFGRKHSKRTIDWVVFGFGVFLTLIEIYKQVFYTYINYGGTYSWYFFPFQFCSVPIYVCLIAPWIKNEKVQTWFYNFLGLYGLLAGLTVMLYPGDVFVTQGSISIHTMLWHSSMVIIGVYVLCAKNMGRRFMEVIKGYAVYVGFVLIALFGFDILLEKVLHGGFNMFFISPLQTHRMVVFDMIEANFGWYGMFFSYLLAFFLGALLIWAVTKLIRWLLHFSAKEKATTRDGFILGILSLVLASPVGVTLAIIGLTKPKTTANLILNIGGLVLSLAAIPLEIVFLTTIL